MELILINLGLTLLETYGPKIQAAMDRGEVTPKQLQELNARIAAVRSGDAFKFPEFKIEE